MGTSVSLIRSHRESVSPSLGEGSSFEESLNLRLLYTLNLNDFSRAWGADYETYENRRLEMASHRVSLESVFLQKIKDKQTFKVPSDCSNKEELFQNIIEYINSKLDNSYVDWFEHSASVHDGKNFIREYGADQVYFTQYLSQLSVIAPERAAIEIYLNLFDETGSDNSSEKNYDISLFHPELFRRLYYYFNLSPVDRFHNNSTFNTETYYCICMMLLSIRLGYLCGAGALFTLETSIPYQLMKINNGMMRLNVPYNERLFFELHCTLDTIHARRWWDHAIKNYLATPRDISQLVLGIDLAISARNRFWNGLYNLMQK